MESERNKPQPLDAIPSGVGTSIPPGILLPWDTRIKFTTKTELPVGDSASFSCAGTCGELCQGVLQDGQDFLVNNSISVFSTIHITLTSQFSGIRIHPSTHTEKIRKAAMTFQKFFNIDLLAKGLGLNIRKNSKLPIGHGCASSSADMAATFLCLATLFKKPLTYPVLDILMTHIEPTNPCYYRHPVVFNHKIGYVYQKLSPLPKMKVVAFLGTGSVNTASFNRLKRPYNASEKFRCEKILDILRFGIQSSSLEAIGKACMMSAILNQEFNYNESFEIFQSYVNKFNFLLGLNVGHSGSSIGFLMSDSVPIAKVTSLIDAIKDIYPETPAFITNSILSKNFDLVIT